MMFRSRVLVFGVAVVALWTAAAAGRGHVASGASVALGGSKATKAWSYVAPMHDARLAFAAAARGGKLYAIGGCGDSCYMYQVEAYAPTTNTWSFAAPMPTPRNRVSA